MRRRVTTGTSVLLALLLTAPLLGQNYAGTYLLQATNGATVTL